ncbi:hypothetical protein [Simkania sp.]|uniref:hypothetical protein n=1 Tax=Simkania sp. TaxID=34094 RepID=UPI003B529DD4
MLKEKTSLLRKLPLLRWSADYFNSVSFDKTLIICVQHLYSTTYTMFNEFFNKGLKPQNLHIIGKCYSTDPKVYQQLKNDGVNISSMSATFDSHGAYDQAFDQNINEFFNNIIEDLDLADFDKIIILDDGGFLIQIANEKLSHSLNNVIGIEQTSAGFNRVSKQNIFFPVINTARSWVKMKYESPIIINLALRKLSEKIAHLEPKPKNILIMGYGTLGKVIFTTLKDQYNVSYFDMDPTKSMFPLKNLNSRLSEFDLIIGSTGETSLTKETFKYLKKPVVLASVSSSDREFDSVYLRKNTARTFNCHSDLNINGIHLLNCGFPVNFDSDYSAIDTDNFQLTRSLIFGAVCQAYLTNSSTTGFLELDNRFQKAIEENL